MFGSKYGACPNCGRRIVKGLHGFYCEGVKDDVCHVVFPDRVLGYRVTGDDVAEVGKCGGIRRSVTVCWLMVATFVLFFDTGTNTIEVDVEGDRKVLGRCPRCGRNVVEYFGRGGSRYMCESELPIYPGNGVGKGCGFSFGREQDGLIITRDVVRQLFERERAVKDGKMVKLNARKGTITVSCGEGENKEGGFLSGLKRPGRKKNAVGT